VLGLKLLQDRLLDRAMTKYWLNFRVIVSIFVISGIFGTISAQIEPINFCTNHQVLGIAWSPDGQQLAITVSSGVHFYDRNLELQKSIAAPRLNFGYIGRIREPIWSPDGTWILLPYLEPLEFMNIGGSRPWSIANVQTGYVKAVEDNFYASEIIWSPDNQYILSLYYEQELGLNLPYTGLRVSRAAIEDQIPTRTTTVRFDDVHFYDIRWDEPEFFTARLDGILLSFDSITLQHVDAAPVFYPEWWTSNHDSTWEAAFKPDLMLYVRASGQDEQTIEISPTQYLDGEVFTIGQVDIIHWLLDNQRFIGMYPRYFPHPVQEEFPDFRRILQGTIVDAPTTTEINHFVIQTETEIQAYSISNLGDRIAILRDDVWIEIWNPLTGERLETIEIPRVEIEGYCGD
jgi:WD40 repeat protein